MSAHPHTPCIGICSTTYGDSVCRGCTRFVDEVIAWNGYNSEQKQRVWQRLNRLTNMVVDHYLRIDDSGQLQQQLEYQNLPFPLELTPQGQAMRLLRALGTQPVDYQPFGIHLLPPAEDLSPRELYQKISRERWALSQIHYKRHQRRQLRAGTR